MCGDSDARQYNNAQSMFEPDLYVTEQSPHVSSAALEPSKSYRSGHGVPANPRSTPRNLHNAKRVAVPQEQGFRCYGQHCTLRHASVRVHI